MKQNRSQFFGRNSRRFQLALETRLLIVGLSLAMASLLASQLIASQPPAWLPHSSVEVASKFLEHLGFALLIALAVGLGLDRLFHASHLNAIIEHMPAALESAIRSVGGKHRVVLLDNAAEMYTRLSAAILEHPYLLTTTVDTGPRVTLFNVGRSDFHQHKVQLAIEGRLHVKEVVSLKALPMVKQHLQLVTVGLGSVPDAPQVTSVYDSREIVVGNLQTYLNFCVFLKRPDNLREGLVAFGWFSDEDDTFQQHSCILADHRTWWPSLRRTSTFCTALRRGFCLTPMLQVPPARHRSHRVHEYAAGGISPRHRATTALQPPPRLHAL